MQIYVIKIKGEQVKVLNKIQFLEMLLRLKNLKLNFKTSVKIGMKFMLDY